MDKKTAEVLKKDWAIKKAVQKEKIKQILITGRGKDFAEELIIAVANSSLRSEIQKNEIVATLSSKISKYRYNAELKGTEYLAGYLANIVLMINAYVIVDNIHSKINGGEN